MSTDLELRLPIINRIGNSPEASDSDRIINEEDEGCRTPRSPQHRIPAAVTCPPAPKKRKRTETWSRRLGDELEMEFFEVESLLEMIERKVSMNRSYRRKLW
ncbi:cyclin-dependent protein kinase inhibitor SMR3-like [Andrographis paniculata]|uniref:cyclin-dependent protein kinase inhibitor SMR3-like n=1 Tax=Andrographis paniculata TaxID=175694 RepID=UPI0021E74D97|nr:cyclin-dependent protein kinase inhibitor SMR3-like [Andrographis paniculata]